MMQKVKDQNIFLKNQFAQLKKKIVSCLKTIEKKKEQNLYEVKAATHEDEIRNSIIRMEYLKKQLLISKCLLANEFNLDK